MQQAVIPSSWLSLTKTWSAERLISLRREVEKRGIAETDLPAVLAVWTELQNDARRTAAS